MPSRYEEQLELNTSNNSDEITIEKLFEQYRPLINRRISKEISKGNIYESDREDLLQEGLISLDKAFHTYDAELNVPFGVYARVCVMRDFNLYLAKHGRLQEKRNQVSLDMYMFEDQRHTLYDFVEGRATRTISINDVMHSLEPKDRAIISLRMEGYTYKEIAEKTGVNTKRVDNVIQKLKRKYEKAQLENQNMLGKNELSEIERQVYAYRRKKKSYKEIACILMLPFSEVRNIARRANRKIERMSSTEE